MRMNRHDSATEIWSTRPTASATMTWQRALQCRATRIRTWWFRHRQWWISSTWSALARAVPTIWPIRFGPNKSLLQILKNQFKFHTQTIWLEKFLLLLLFLFQFKFFWLALLNATRNRISFILKKNFFFLNLCKMQKRSKPNKSLLKKNKLFIIIIIIYVCMCFKCKWIEDI